MRGSFKDRHQTPDTRIRLDPSGQRELAFEIEEVGPSCQFVWDLGCIAAVVNQVLEVRAAWPHPGPSRQARFHKVHVTALRPEVGASDVTVQQIQGRRSGDWGLVDEDGSRPIEARELVWKPLDQLAADWGENAAVIAAVEGHCAGFAAASAQR